MSYIYTNNICKQQNVNFNLDNEDWQSSPKVDQLLQSHKQKWEEKIRVILAETLVQKENEFNKKLISLEDYIDLQKQENDALKSSNEKLLEKVQKTEEAYSKHDEKYAILVSEIQALQEELTLSCQGHHAMLLLVDLCCKKSCAQTGSEVPLL